MKKKQQIRVVNCQDERSYISVDCRIYVDKFFHDSYEGKLSVNPEEITIFIEGVALNDDLEELKENILIDFEDELVEVIEKDIINGITCKVG